jgi:hypothetical protein
MATELPGVSFTASPPREVPSPLRSDVAGFVMRTRRGPVGVPVRVAGWREALYHFGGLDERFDGPYALRGYFDNGGEYAHVVRVAADAPLAEVEWDTTVALGLLDLASMGGVRPRYRIEATSPGSWARDLAVDVRYVRWGASGSPELEVVVRPVGEAEERITGIPPAQLHLALERSRFVRMHPLADPPAPGTGSPPASFDWPRQRVAVDEPALATHLDAYRAAAVALCDEPEVALLVAPDLHRDLALADAATWVRELLAASDSLLDRLVVVDAPPESANPGLNLAIALAWWRQSLGEGDPSRRAGALYHPRLWVTDPLGGIRRPLRSIPPSGHVAGVISRLDRERGAHHTPANARIEGAVGLDGEPEESDRPLLYRGAVNLLRCHPRDGLTVWGGRTLALDPEDGGFVAHRRLLHRLVRAIRRAAEPLVFDNNGPPLWLAFVRAVTTVLMPAFRAGALRGLRPEEAFRVKCDEETNPPEERDAGRCLCVVAVAPATPMEFIELRVALSRDGTLEVLTP